MQGGKKHEAAEERAARLAEALRQNLKRRKSQARVRKAAPKAEGDTKTEPPRQE